MFLLIYNFALAFAEKVVAQRGNLIPRGKHIAQVVASHKCSVLNGGYTGRKHQRAAQTAAATECTLSDASKFLREPYVQQILLLGGI